MSVRALMRLSEITGMTEWPNTACSGRVGFATIFKHFSDFELFCSQEEPTPAHLPQPEGQVRDPTRLRLGDDVTNRWAASNPHKGKVTFRSRQ